MSLFRAFGAFASSGAGAKPGMVLLTPTSIAHSGTSASIGANGQVTFTAVTSLSLNGVFSATYDNYLVAVAHDDPSANSMQARLRVSGSDASGTNYTNQFLTALSTTVSASRSTSDTVSYWGTSEDSGDQVFIYGPFLAQPTAFRNVNVRASSGAGISDRASTHSLSTSYDGFTILNGTFTGKLAVYGIRG